MADSQLTDNASPKTATEANEPGSATPTSGWRSRWVFPILRIAFLVFAAWLIWYTAGHWDRWTGAARFVSTDDAFVAGDVTPLSARVSGYITEMPVNDFQTIRKGDLIAVIDPSDYKAQLDLAQANLAAAEATLANLENQRAVQQALVREAQATIDAAEADVLRYQLEDQRQRNLYKTGIAGTQQLVEQADANATKAIAQRRLNVAQLDQQKAALAAIDIQEKQLRAQIHAAEAQVALASQFALYANPVARRWPRGPAASATRAIRQCRHASDRRPSAAEHLGARELQGNADDQHPARPACSHHRRRLS